jgi:hypothetical protein
LNQLETAVCGVAKISREMGEKRQTRRKFSIGGHQTELLLQQHWQYFQDDWKFAATNTDEFV